MTVAEFAVVIARWLDEWAALEEVKSGPFYYLAERILAHLDTLAGD